MSPRKKQSNGLATQQKMLRAAVTLFLEKGYTRATTGEIAKAAGWGQSAFFHAFSSKEALLLELVQRMFGGQFDLAERHTSAEDPVFLYAVETALQLHIAELTEPLRELYVMAYSLPTTSEYLYAAHLSGCRRYLPPISPALSQRISTKWRLHRRASCAASWLCRATCISRLGQKSRGF